MQDHDTYVAEARRLGHEAGETSGSWTADGTTDPAHARRVLAMLDDGDPEAYDHLPPMPDLSGAWADGRTPQSVARLVTGRDPDDLGAELVDAIADAWEDGVRETYEAACARELRTVADRAPGTFRLSIDLGNAAMRDLADVADALAKLARDGFGESGLIRDENGNTVGRYGVEA